MLQLQGDLLLNRGDAPGQQAVQAECAALVQGERSILVEQWPLEKLCATEPIRRCCWVAEPDSHYSLLVACSYTSGAAALGSHVSHRRTLRLVNPRPPPTSHGQRSRRCALHWQSP